MTPEWSKSRSKSTDLFFLMENINLDLLYWQSGWWWWDGMRCSHEVWSLLVAEKRRDLIHSFPNFVPDPFLSFPLRFPFLSAVSHNVTEWSDLIHYYIGLLFHCSLPPFDLKTSPSIPSRFLNIVNGNENCYTNVDKWMGININTIQRYRLLIITPTRKVASSICMNFQYFWTFVF